MLDSHRVCNQINTMGVTSGAGTAYPFGPPEFTPGFQWGSCYSTFSFICMLCRSLFVLLFFFFWPLCCLFFFDIQILIAPLVSSNFSYRNPWILFGTVRIVIVMQLDLQSMPITTKVVSLNPAHGEMYLIQHYVTKFVDDIRQVVVFSGYSVSFTNKTDIYDITEILLKVVLHTMTLTFGYLYVYLDTFQQLHLLHLPFLVRWLRN